MRAALAIAALALAAGCSLTKPEEEPAYIKATEVESRVNRIEQQNQALLDLQRDVESLKAEVRRLRGELDEAQHTSKSGRDQSRDLYSDLDRRLAALEARLAGSVAGSATGGAVAPPTAGDRDAYQAALEHLKTRDYTGAEKALNDFIAAYPQSPLADNAKYWLGETYYVEKRYGEAIGAFQQVTTEHPDSRKVPDALLKIGYAQYELKRYHESREVLARLVQKYPDAPAATEARERLKRIDAERH